MFRNCAAALVIAAFAFGGQSAIAAVRHFAVGQIWAYHNRPQDAGSLLRIGAIGTFPGLGEVFHISVVGVHLGGSVTPTVIGHLPLSRAAMEESVSYPATSNETFPDVAAGIDEWRAAKGGLFTIPLAKIVEIADGTIPRKSDL